MLVEIFIFFEIIVIGLFLVAFYTKQEIMWALTAIFSGAMMFTSYNIEIANYVYNTTLGAYQTVITSFTYPYLSRINMIFFGLALALGIFDLFDKYGRDMPGSDNVGVGGSAQDPKISKKV